MRRHQNMCGGLLAIVALLLVGCAARSMVARTAPITTDLSRYSTLALTLESTVDDDVEDDVRTLAESILSQITALGLFTDVCICEAEEGAADTVIMNATMTQLRRVSGGQRLFAGVFAGRAGATVEIDLIDAQSGELLESQVVTGESGSTGFSGTTWYALTEAAEGVARWLSGRPMAQQ